MIINNNLSAMNALRQLGMNTNGLSKTMEKLSSGQRINRAGDDAAGLSISEKMRGQIRGLEQASQNAQDGISLIQTAEGALNETHAILQRMKELTVQAANGTNGADEITAIQSEMDELAEEINRIANTTEFNGMTLLNGEFGNANGGINIHVGANSEQIINIEIENMDATTLGVAGLDLANNVDNAIDAVDAATILVSSQRSDLGAKQNRLEHTIANLDNTAENLQAAESRIRDTDMAKEMVEFTKLNIMTQASQSMLAQANQTPQGVLSLL